MQPGHGARAGRARLQDRRGAVSHVGAGRLRGRAARRSSPGCRSRRRPPASSSIIRLYSRASAPSALVWLPAVAALAGMTIVAGNLMAIPQRNIKRLLAYSGIAHIGYMLMGLAAISSAGVAMVLFYLVAYLFGNMGAFFVVEAVERSPSESDSIDAYRGLAQRSPLLALAMLVFLLSLGGIPFVAGFWAKLYVFLAAVAARDVLAGVPRRGAHGRRALLLPARRAPDVHRCAVPSRAAPPLGAADGRHRPSARSASWRWASIRSPGSAAVRVAQRALLSWDRAGPRTYRTPHASWYTIHRVRTDRGPAGRRRAARASRAFAAGISPTSS